MLQFLTSLGRSTNRRSSSRYATTDVRIALQWWARGVAIESAALLLNVGEGGALMLAGNPPPLHKAIRLRLDRIGGADYIDAQVVRVCGLHAVAVRFRDLSPERFLALMTSKGDTPG